MNPVLVAGVGFLALLVLFAIGMRIGFAMALVGFCGMVYLRTLSGMGLGKSCELALGMFTNGPFSSTSKESLVVIPMFILMGAVCARSGISRQLYTTCYKWVSGRRGGLAIATEAACALFGAICGSATATTASMGRICLPEMDKYGYKRTISCGAISAGGTLGLMIPPSTGLMLYAVSAGIGVGKMFLAGILPGIVLMLCYVSVVMIWCHKDPMVGPTGEAFGLKEKINALAGVLPVMVLFCMVLGGILFGWCSATEGGAFGAFGAFVFMFIRGKLHKKQVLSVLEETTEITAMIFFVMIGSDIFSQFIAMTNISNALLVVSAALNLNRWVVLLLCLMIYGLLGCFVDTMPLICLLTPIFLPIIRQLGFDELWFGILMVMLMEMGLMTPPVGMCCFTMAGITRGTTSLRDIFAGTMPFLAGITMAMLIVMLCPVLATWLPGFLIG